MSLGNRMMELRRKKKLTQQELADKLYVTDKTVSSWESNRTEPNLEILVKISDILDCPVSYLIYGDTEKNDIETEIKIKVSKDEFKEIELFLRNNGDFLNEHRQVDTYYQPIHRKILKSGSKVINEWLRIGIRGNKKILNYKNWHDDFYCDEYEVEIDDEKNMDRIFKILGLEEIVTVDKMRSTYLYLDKYEIALDYVEKLGYFVEIEVKKYTESVMREYDYLLKIAKEFHLNLNNIDKRGYPYHLIYKEDDSMGKEYNN